MCPRYAASGWRDRGRVVSRRNDASVSRGQVQRGRMPHLLSGIGPICTRSRADGGAATLLASTDWIDRARWSPDERSIAFSAYGDNQMGDSCSLFLRDADGTASLWQADYVLFGCPSGGLSFVWSNDGGEIAYSSEGANVDAIDPQTGNGVASSPEHHPRRATRPATSPSKARPVRFTSWRSPATAAASLSTRTLRLRECRSMPRALTARHR